MSELPAPVVSAPEPPRPQTLVCANCHAELRGEYCAACGQRNEPHIHTVAHFAGEAFESISHADSRLWRTLWYLLSRPGFLTQEFFAGRRVAYLPPFRLYLVLSVLLFLLASLPSGSPSPTAVVQVNRGPSNAQQIAQQAVAEALESEGQLAVQAPVDADDGKLRVRLDGVDEFCKPFEAPDAGGAGAAARANVRQFCDRIRNDAGDLFVALGHSLPKAMFIFLPLLAGIMKLMYWRPKRYYVEHLLFLVHNHAAVFLTVILLTLVSYVPWIGDFTPLLVFISLGYLSWYIFRAMRNVYGQHGGLTFLKYFVLGWSYIITAFFTLLLTLIFLALLGT
jgi:Protein of unknown function (DUF3667)